jgi:hypothetical protein
MRQACLGLRQDGTRKAFVRARRSGCRQSPDSSSAAGYQHEVQPVCWTARKDLTCTIHSCRQAEVLHCVPQPKGQQSEQRQQQPAKVLESCLPLVVHADHYKR